MKTEVLQSIKKAEEEYKSMISAAEEEKKRSIASAEQEADQLVQKAKLDVEDYRKKCLADARNDAAQKFEETLKKGEQGTAAMRSAAVGNLSRAVELLVERFKGQLNV
ncbi:MAG: ATPase [Methanoculleus sp. SDB]|nr:MAG: ATPase [Methanoculleus sp. SDB]